MKMLKDCPFCNCDIYADLNPNYLRCSGCDWRVTYRLLEFDPDQKIEFVYEKSMPCVDCGIWVPIEDVVDGLCLRCLDNLLEEDDEEDDF